MYRYGPVTKSKLSYRVWILCVVASTQSVFNLSVCAVNFSFLHFQTAIEKPVAAPSDPETARLLVVVQTPGKRKLSPGLDNSTGNSTGTRQLLDRILDSCSTAARQDSSTATRQTSTDPLRTDPPLTACAWASSCQARQLDRPRQTSTRG